MATTNPGFVTNEQQLQRLLASEKPLVLSADDAPEERVTLPERVKSLLKQILAEFASGQDVTPNAQEPEMTAQEAAEYLKISLQYLERKMNYGQIPFRMDGEQPLFKVSEVRLFEKKMGKVIEPPIIKMRDMRKDMKWLREYGNEHQGKWVAIYEDRLIASCANAKDAFAAADDAGLPQAMVTFIEETPKIPNWKGWVNLAL